MADFEIQLTGDVEGELARRLLAAGEIKISRSQLTLQFSLETQPITLEMREPDLRNSVEVVLRGEGVVKGVAKDVFKKSTSAAYFATNVWLLLED